MLRDVSGTGEQGRAEPDKACKNCGSRNEDHRVRCRRCGANISRFTHDPRPQASDGPVFDAWLNSLLLDAPFGLLREREVTIGRGAENDIVLPVTQVSRAHAVVKWDGEGFALIDLDSSNGTTVNGETARRRRLQDGDRICVGPCEITFHTGAASEPRKACDETHLMTPPGAFAGELGLVSMPELWQLVELNAKTGVLVFRQGEERGSVYFARGRAVHAELRDLTGDAAALAVLAVTAGSFRFFSGKTAVTLQTIRRSTASLLLEAARRLDEAALARGEAASVETPRPSRETAALPGWVAEALAARQPSARKTGADATARMRERAPTLRDDMDRVVGLSPDGRAAG